jgi:CheY-like chemotaxis protein
MVWRRPTPWPTPAQQDLVRLSQVLVVDDKEFEYTPLFERDGYHITVWDTVKNLRQLESGEFHVILLDMRGIGVQEAQFQGAGLIEHIKAVNPAQYIVAYSSAKFTLDYQRFFEQADDKIRKSEDYARFKRSVDTGLQHRFSESYYRSKIAELIGGDPDRQLQRSLDRSVRGDVQTDRLRNLLLRRGVAQEDIDRVLTVCSIASSSLALLLS